MRISKVIRSLVVNKFSEQGTVGMEVVEKNETRILLQFSRMPYKFQDN